MIEQQIPIADGPEIPGLRFRHFDPGRDYEPFVELVRESNVADGVDWIPTVEGLRNDHEHTSEFDPRRDIVVAEIDGAIVAGAETHVRTRDGEGIHHLDGWVLPSWRRRGLGRALLHWTERRAAEVARVDGRTGARALTSWPDEQQIGAVRLYESEGYRIVRYGFLMLRDLAEPIPELEVPDGLEMRPVVEADHRAIWDADVEAFRDHWSSAERTEADYEGWFTNPDLDTGLWRVAWDGERVAGSVMTFVFADENATLGVSRGWLEHVSVRRPWRRRGLASALIAASLRALRERGLQEAALGVDAENLSGALRVYEALGFRRARTAVSYRKALPAD